MGLTYYYYPDANCSSSTCQLDVGFISSTNGGASWSSPMQLAGPMSLGWLASTDLGPMVGDYISTSFAGGTAHAVFALGQRPKRRRSRRGHVHDDRWPRCVRRQRDIEG